MLRFSLLLLVLVSPLGAQEEPPLDLPPQSIEDLPPLPELEPNLPDPQPAQPELPPIPAGMTAEDFAFNPDAKFTAPKKTVLRGRDLGGEFHEDGTFHFKAKGQMHIKGNAGQEAFGDRAVFNPKTETYTLTGNVVFYQRGLLSKVDSVIYYRKTKKFETRGLRTSMDPILLESGRFRSEQIDGRTVYIGDNAGVSTHDVEDPNFWLRAKRTAIFPDDKVVFQDLKFYFGDTPLIWLPYLSQPLNQDLGYHVLPGGRSNLGLFLKNRYGVMLGGERDPETGENKSAWLLSQWHVDGYSRRGVGLGVDLLDTRQHEDDQFGWLKLYHIYDFDPNIERSGTPRNGVDHNRYAVELAQRFRLHQSEVATYGLDVNMKLLSDAFYLEDYQPKIFRSDPAPDNTFAFTRRTANSLTTLGGRIRLNDFYTSDTRLPELTFDWVRQPILNSKFLYESQTSAGIYEEHLGSAERDSLKDSKSMLLPGDPRISEIDGLLEDRGFTRFHTYHEISRPTSIGALNIVPRVGAGYTNYSSVEGPSSSTSRGHFFAGVDTSLKFTKAYDNLISEKWGLNGALHVVQPYANLSWLSTNELDSSFGRIDRLTPSTRPRPLGVGRFTAIDDFSDWSILRLGIRNRLVTQRDGGTHDWLTLDTYLDTFFDDPEFSRKVSNLYNDLTWNPLPWVELELETQFPLFSESNFTEVAASSRFMPNDSLEFDLSYRLLRNHPILQDSNRVSLETFYRINENWGIGAYNRWEFEDSTLELQQYSVHYDFDSWIGSVGVFQRDNRQKDEYGIVFSFGLKDFPSLALPIKVDAE